MSDSRGSFYDMVQVVGTSSESFDDAVRTAVAKAAARHPKLDWFQVDELRGAIRDGRVAEFQVMMRLGSRSE